jgi:hypothetical protein
MTWHGMGCGGTGGATGRSCAGGDRAGDHTSSSAGWVVGCIAYLRGASGRAGNSGRRSESESRSDGVTTGEVGMAE